MKAMKRVVPASFAICVTLGLSLQAAAEDIRRTVYGGSCAIDAIFLCLHSKSIRVDYQEVFRQCAPHRDAYGLVNLRTTTDVLRAFGVQTTAMRIGKQELRNLEGAFLLVIKEPLGNHLVFSQIKNGSIKCFDPAESDSPTLLTDDDLDQTWFGIAILCQ